MVATKAEREGRTAAWKIQNKTFKEHSLVHQNAKKKSEWGIPDQLQTRSPVSPKAYLRLWMQH